MRNKLEEIGVALALLTRLPLPRLSDAAFARQGASVWAWPLAGLVVGLLAAAVAWAALAIGLPTPLAALLALATQMTVTGAMHEDGLADTADGLWGGWTPERRLEIMKDSHIGTYGVLALVVFTGLRWSVLTGMLTGVLTGVLTGLLTLGVWPIVALAVLSRAAMPVLMLALPNARGTGLSHQVGAPSAVGAALAVLGAVAIALACIGLTALPAALCAGFGAGALGWIAKRKIGGQTGDILGASQQVCEVMAGLTLLALLG